MKVWLLLNLAVLALALRVGGWGAVGGLLLVELGASVLLAAVFLYGLAGREDASKRRIRVRMEELLAERDEVGGGGQRVVDPPWRGPR